MTKTITRDDILRVINDQGTSLSSVDRALSTQSWVPFQLFSGWMVWNTTGQDAPPAYYVDRMNRVTFRGLMQKTGGAPAVNELICQLPSEAYPPYYVRVPCVGDTGLSTITIQPDGTVRWRSGGSSWLALDGVSFFAGSKGVSA